MKREKLLDEIYSQVFKAYDWLFKSAIHSGHWGEVRSTALVGLCLKLREPANSPWLESVKNWLLREQKPLENNLASWGEELWDTSAALIALKYLGVSPKDPRYQKAVRWILSLYNKSGRNNWNDEPWETSWSLWAILETRPPKWEEITYNSALWLLSLQDASGKIISPHYTAYFIRVAYVLISINPNLSREDKETFEAAIRHATSYLVSVVNKEILWTGEAWSNGQILWILSTTGQLSYDDSEFISMIVDWFMKNQGENGQWVYVEDTASAILGLVYLAKGLESLSEIDLQNKLSARLKTPVLCLRRKLIHREEDGYISINISPQLQKVIAALVGLASFATVVISLWDFIVSIINK
ncbi:MAG: hypothetical protein QXS54_09645 [Candidatus Methanomethylicaceae archaeon]